jgi:hypothetical protein
VVRLDGLRQWVEHGDTPVKPEVGWGDFQVRADRASRRQWELVCCAFCCCWWAASHHTAASVPTLAPPPAAHAPGAGEKCRPAGCHPTADLARDLARRAHHLLGAALSSTGASTGASTVVAPRPTAGAGLA